MPMSSNSTLVSAWALLTLAMSSRIGKCYLSSLAGRPIQLLHQRPAVVDAPHGRGQLRKLAEPTITPTGKRIPGLELDHPRQLTLIHALVSFAHIAAGNTFTTAEIHPAVIEAIDCAPKHYTLGSLRYDLSKLRAKGLVAKRTLTGINCCHMATRFASCS
jgi:hypothetical protein